MALLTAARTPTNRWDFALVATLGLLGLRIREATVSNIADLSEEHGHRVLLVRGKGDKVVLVPLPPAVGRAVDQRTTGPILLTCRGTRVDRHCATRRPFGRAGGGASVPAVWSSPCQAGQVRLAFPFLETVSLQLRLPLHRKPVET